MTLLYLLFLLVLWLCASSDTIHRVRAVHQQWQGNLVDLVHNNEVAKIQVLKQGLSTLSALLFELDSKPSLHKIILEAYGSGDAAQVITDNTLGAIIDSFLTPSPWWTINKEAYHHYNSATAVAKTHMIVLHRFKPIWELYLRRLAAVQYPPTQEICEQSPLYIGRMINSGWGSQILFAFHMQNSPYSVFNVWYSENNDPHESMQTCHAQDCSPDIVNKWECVFLPLTNCSLSKVEFTHCHAPHYAKNTNCFPMDFFVVQNMSATGGAMVSWDGKLGKLPSNVHQHAISEHYPLPGTDPDGQEENGLYTGEIPNERFIYAQDKILPRPVSREINFYLFGSLFRPNYNLRRRVMIRLDELISTRQIPFRVGVDQCVAIHIRRGDRMVDTSGGNSHQQSINMKEYCYVLTGGYRISRDNCTEEALSAVKRHWSYGSMDCAGLSDYGCWDAHSFGELTLVDYLKKAWLLLPLITNVFVMTDDGPWLEKEIAGLSVTLADRNVVDGIGIGNSNKSNLNLSSYTIGMLPAEPNSRARGKNGTKYTVDFWTSIAVARHCQGFVGHFSSGLAHFVYNAMCFQHGHSTAQCPPGADIGNWGP